MKTRSIIISALSAFVLLSSCAGTDEISPSQYSSPSVSTSAAEVTGGKIEITLSASALKTNFSECGFYYGTDNSLSDAKKLTATAGSSFSSTFFPDGYGKTYYWLAYLSDHGSEIRSEVKSVKSLTFPEYVKVSAPTTEITPQGVVVVGATMEIAEGLILTDRGVCYSRTANPTIASPTVSSAPAAGVIAARIEGLTIGTTYHLRCYACQGEQVTYGSEVTVVPCKTPTVTTKAVTDITSSTASCGGEVTSDGGAEVTARGVVWSTSPNPTVDLQTKTTDGTGTGSFTSSIIGLKAGTKYYVRAYATISAGTGYGAERTFSTDTAIPSVSTSEVTGIASSAATCGGNVTSDGGAAVTARGVVWSTSPNPTISLSTKTSDGTGIGSFTSSMTGLQYGTKYYVRSYATNSVGTGYGAERTFTTNAIIPSVSTSEVSGITSSTAACGGEVTSDGGATVTARGVVWSTSQNPTITSNKGKTTDGTGIGSFTSSLTGLSASTTYYVRAYATNSNGTAYGEQKTFTTTGSTSYEAVDLGLSVKWATFNVGASKPEDYGDYYAWGETSTKSNYDWSTYKWCKGSHSTITKYCTSSSYGTVDNKTVLESSDDVAHVKWGGSWRMPTSAEWDELTKNCTWTWTTISGVNGYKVTSKKSGYTGRWIFLPAAGDRYDSDLGSVGSNGYYWSSSLGVDYSNNAWGLNFNSYYVDRSSGFYRYYGHSVRPVCD